MKRYLLRLIVYLALVAGTLSAAQSQFPSEGLEDRIAFWKEIFTEYAEDDVVIHDLYRVNLIYDVAAEEDVRNRIQSVKNALDEIQANLETPAGLSERAQSIYRLLTEHGISLSAGSIRDLKSRIHTQHGIKERFRQGIIRSGRYVERFQSIFQTEGIPRELAVLPLVESSFENRSRSKAGAAGIWQFTRRTARLYMTVSQRVDERFDPLKATRAAARLLRDNYKALGSWPLAITAYNHGRDGMLRAKAAHGPDIVTIIDEYRGPYFGFASMNFYAEFLAAVDVYQGYQQYFGALAIDKPGNLDSETQAAEAAPRSGRYRVRRGDTLSEIAERFRISLRDLMRKNGLEKTTIYAGQILLVR